MTDPAPNSTATSDRGDEALRRSEERYRALVEATSQAVWSWSPESASGDFERTQRWWEQITGQTPDEQRGSFTAWLDVVHPDDRAVAGAAWNRALATGVPYDVEYRVRAKTGGWRHIQARGTPIPGPDGTTREWVGTLDDVTERKRAETENARLLREVETERRRLADVFQHAPSFTCVLRGPGHVFERANDRYLELVGGRDVIGRAVREAIPEAESQGFTDILDRVYRTGEQYVGTDARITLRRGSGLEERRLDFVYQPLRDPDGTVSGIIVQGIDLTERRRAEQGLERVTAESERQRRMFDTALSHTADFVYLFGLDGRFTYVNKALLDLWRKSLPEAVGKTFFELDYPADLAARLHKQIQDVIATRQPLRDEAPYTSADGTRAYEYIFVPVFGADGAVEAVAGSTRDITDRKATEVALRASEQRYRVLVTASSDVVYRMSADWSEMHPLDGRDLVASNVEPIRDWMQKNLPAFEHPRVAEAIARSIATRQPFEMEHRVVRPNGTLGWTLSRAAPILDDRGAIVEWFGTARDVTERKQSGEEMARLAEALGLALAAADLGTWEWDPVTDVMRLSSRAAEIYGVDPAGPHRREALRELLHPDDRARARAAAERAAAERTDYDLEYRLARPGAPVWVAAHGRGVYDAAGKLTRMNGVVRDVTARKRVEDDLRDIRSRMEAALGAAAIGTWSWDVPGDRFSGDPSLARIFGVEPSAVAGGPIAGLLTAIHSEDRDRVSALIARALETGGGYEADYRVHQRDGSWRWVTARGRVERDASGRAVRFPGVVIDVTERKWAEEALALMTAESERKRRLYETALNNTPDLVYVFDLDHRFVYANDALLRMWGKTWDEAIGKSCLELGYEGWHADMHDREIEQVRNTKRPIRGEVPFTGTAGRRVYDYIFVPVFGATGEVEAVAGTTRDITERQAMEQELREADRKKDDFIALLAHELRNPLAPIRNGLEVVSRSDQGAVRERAQAMMGRQLTHMVRMIDDLLDVSRIGRNKMELRRERLALADVVDSAVETARPALDEAGHALHVALPPAAVHLDADLTRLSQVLSNLLTNSAKYTPHGGTIWLSAAQAGGRVEVSVRDTGIGIPVASLPTIFDMFSQVDRSVERNSGGLGIGLALVKGLVEMHGGTVAAHSEGPGRGSVFTVVLPVAAGAPDLAPAPGGGASPGTKRRVLVVDDNRDGAESMAEMLSLLGHEVATAHDGLEGVEQAARFRPEVILMDLGMPRLNGLDAARRIREQPWGRGVTIIALTGWGQENDRARSREAGCNGHLVKPVGLSELERLLVELAG